MVGVPARRIGWMSRFGERLSFDSDGLALRLKTQDRYRLVGEQCELVMEGSPK